MITTLKEISSIGRATVLHTEGWVFESPISYIYFVEPNPVPIYRVLTRQVIR